MVSTALPGSLVDIPTAGTPIIGTLYLPDGEPESVTIIHSATATPQGFYRGFAQHLAGHGIAALTYDYRGTGHSGPSKLFPDLRMRDWLTVDMPTVTRWAQNRFDSIPITAVGHSIGGHGLAMGSGLGIVDRFILAAAHIAYTPDIPSFTEQLRVKALLNWVGPTIASSLGYMPSRKLGLGEDLPTNVLIEWASWTKLSGFLYDDPTLGAGRLMPRIDADVLCVAATDDLWATPEQAAKLGTMLTNARVTNQFYSPADLGISSLGHHGIFHRKKGKQIWEDMADWLSS